MRCFIALSLLSFAGRAGAELVSGASPFTALPPSTARRTLDMDGVFDRVMSAAGVGLTSGKIMLLRPMRAGRREQVATTVGKARLMPLFELNFGGASIFAHVTF